MKTSLAMQRQAVSHLIALHEDQGATFVEAARQAVKTLAELEEGYAVHQAAVKLREENPALARVLAMDGAKIVGVHVVGETE